MLEVSVEKSTGSLHKRRPAWADRWNNQPNLTLKKYRSTINSYIVRTCPGVYVDNNEWLEAEIEWLLSLPEDTAVSAVVPQLIVKQLMQFLKMDIESGRVSPLATRSRNHRVEPPTIDNAELIGTGSDCWDVGCTNDPLSCPIDHKTGAKKKRKYE